MNAEELCAKLHAAGQFLFECSPAPRQGIRVRTPFLYPDGGVIDVFVIERQGYVEVTDFGEALGWLRMQSVGGQLSRSRSGLSRMYPSHSGWNFSAGSLYGGSKERMSLSASTRLLRLHSASRICGSPCVRGGRDRGG